MELRINEDKTKFMATSLSDSERLRVGQNLKVKCYKFSRFRERQ